MSFKNNIFLALALLVVSGLAYPSRSLSQESTPEPTPAPAIQADAGPARKVLVGQKIPFDISASTIPNEVEVQEVVWDFGDGIRTTGESVTHIYYRPGTYKVRLTLNTTQGSSESTTDVNVFSRVIVMLAGSSIPSDQLALYQQQAAEEKTLLLVLQAKGGEPEAVVEEDLTRQLLNAQSEIQQANIIATWTSGAVGANALSRFAQSLRQTNTSPATLSMGNKGIVIFSDTPFAVLSPTAQSTFDQLHTQFVLLSRPAAIPLLLSAKTAEEARDNIVGAQIDHRLLGTFSSRTFKDLGPTNFMSFGINYLVNRGVPINNIILILMIPVIATILAFARQVIGIKGFGLVTPAMTTLAFLVLGLQAGLIVFVVVLLAGTFTRLLVRRFRLLYLPRMALVLTSVSLAILTMLGVGVAMGQTATLSFSIFPILILTVLAEEFIAVQFSRGLNTALRITGWTLLLVIICYYIVSWQLLRTFLLSYPEVVLLAIPINIALGRFSGLRLVEYIRFRELLRYAPPS